MKTAQAKAMAAKKVPAIQAIPAIPRLRADRKPALQTRETGDSYLLPS